MPPDRGHVHATLVRKCASTDVCSVIVRAQVRDFCHEMREVIELRESALRYALQPELELDVRQDRAEVGIAAAFAIAVDRPLHVSRTCSNRCNGVGHATFAVVVRVDSDAGVGKSGAKRADDLVDLPGHRAAVGIAQDERFGARLLRRPQRLEGILRVGLVPVEEVLGVVDHTPPVLR